MKRIFIALACFTFFSCKPKVDFIIINAKVYTLDSAFSVKEAVAVHDGKIVETGTTDDLKKKFNTDSVIDASGKFIYPGFIDAHAHFLGYGQSLQRVNLTGTNSWEEVVARTDSFRKVNKIQPGQWILGRGWDQNDWVVKEFPDNRLLDSLLSDNPVMLTRIDGHAAVANSNALNVAAIMPGDKLTGGEILVKDGKRTGLLIDNAVDLVSNVIPAATETQLRSALRSAEENCFKVGLTTIDDCGLSASSVEFIKKMHEDGSLKMRLYVMLSDEATTYPFIEKNGKIKTDRLNVRSVKVYGDGALGSRGACLLEPYADKPGHFGFLLSNASHFDSVAAFLHKKEWQMCTHAIGDSGNRTLLNIYAKYLPKGNDLRWRIEHAQVVNENDFHYFKDFNVIPSVQPTHATSDMYWAGERLGSIRVVNAYAYKKLMEQNNWIPLGTDFPVEDIDPLKTFYSAVFRKDAKGWPAEGYQMENALTRQQALYGMTLWAARANFEEDEKGSLERGKFADFVVLDKDLMSASENEILATKVVMTFLGGKRVF